MDYQLRVCPDVGGLQWFGMPAPVGQPGPDERRYFVAIEDSDASIRLYEVEWGTDRPSMWNYLDGAANGWAHKTRLFYGNAGLRGTELYDPPHRHVRNRENG